MKRKMPSLQSIGIDKDPQAISSFDSPYPAELIAGCAHDFLKRYEYTGSELVYCDPPYMLQTRTSDRRYRYRFDYREEDHVELLEIISGLPCKVMISGYPSKLYDTTLKGWETVELQVMNQAGVRTEKIWFNFTIDRYYWSTFSGKNYTDRQRIRRRAATWGLRYREMPRHERLAVLASIMEVERDENHNASN